MKARVHYETTHTTTSIDWEDVDNTFMEWARMVADTAVNSGGLGYLLGSKVAIPLHLIVRIEKLED